MREQLKRLAVRIFLTADRAGVHVQPAHYYSSVASRRDLRAREPEWRRRLSPIPFAWNLEDQVTWLESIVGSQPEIDLSAVLASGDSVGGFRYGLIEGQLLHAVIRRLRPRKIAEIGSGSSTQLMSNAVARNVAEGGDPSQITAFDPYTADSVRGLPFTAASNVGGLGLSAANLSLGSGDLLFIDSTHTIRTGSEVSHLYLEVLPNLPSGIIVHIHDIYLPYLFAPDIYYSMFDWQETTLLAALLANSDRFEILASLSALTWDRPDNLRSIFPEFVRRRIREGLYETDQDAGHFPSSIWLRVR